MTKEDYRMEYEWPASQLTRGQMAELKALSKDVHRPITKLIKDAVDVFLSEIKREMERVVSTPAQSSSQETLRSVAGSEDNPDHSELRRAKGGFQGRQSRIIRDDLWYSAIVLLKSGGWEAEPNECCLFPRVSREMSR